MLDEGWKRINENEKTVGRAEEGGGESVVVQFEKKGEEKERTRAEGGVEKPRRKQTGKIEEGEN